MAKMKMNRIKVVLAEKGYRNKWLAEQMNINESTISRWCTNASQPGLETLYQIARVLNVDVSEILVTSVKR